MSYIDFFEFKEHPFRLTPDVAFYFTSETHAETYDSLKYFIDSDEGFFTLIGEPGTGKTITIRKFLNELPEDVEYAYILFPSLEPEDMFRAVLEDFGYKIEPGVSKNTLFSGFRDFLTEKKEQGKRILLVIDEAQNLPVETLEELRILSNLETEKDKLIQFVLAGQPELEHKLNSKELRQLKQRISIQTRLDYLSFLEMQKYVVYRLSKASFKGQYPDQRFYKKLESITSGNPRIINLAMERSLMAAFLKQSIFLEVKDLDAAAKSLHLDPPRVITAEAASKNYTVYGLLAVIAVLAGLLIHQTTANKKMAEQTAKQIEIIQQKAKEQAAAAPVPVVVQAPEPEPQPAPAPIPQPEPESVNLAYVTVEGLNLRSAPTTKEKNIITKLAKGTSVEIKNESDEWYLIVTPDNEYTGWVHRDYILIPEQ